MADTTDTKSRFKSIGLAVAYVLVGAGLTFAASGTTPDPADVTCEAAAAVVASEACQETASTDKADEASEQGEASTEEGE
jgi:hypothetical protein